MKTDDNAELPEGWASALIPDVCELNPSKPKAADYADKLPVTFVPMPAVDADAGAITKPQVRPFSEVRKGFTAFRNNDVILAKITPCMENGKAAVARGLSNGLGFGFTEFHVFRSNGAVLPNYLFLFLRQESFRRGAEQEMTGSVGQKRVPAEYLEQVELPIPPLAEQRRIVAAVEAVLAKVNAARERLNRVPAILKRFRQAVLSAACSGRLTADWREKNPTAQPAAEWLGSLAIVSRESVPAGEQWEPPELPPSWAWCECADLLQTDRSLTYGVIKLGPPVPDGVPCLRSSDVRHLRIDLVGIKRISRTIASEYSRTFLEGGEVLVTVRGTLGGVAVVPPEMKGHNISREVAMIPLRRELCAEFICLWIGSEIAQKWLDEQAKGVAYTGINIVDLKRLPVGLPPLTEQQEIVRRVDKLFALADVIESRLTDARWMCDQLTQAVLAKAFRGELVPTEAELARRENRTYEPAADLLARIRAEREQPAAPTHPKHERTHSAAQPTESKPSRITKTTRLHRALVLAYFTDRQPTPDLLNRTRAGKLASFAQWHFGTALALAPVRGAHGPYDPAIEDIEKDAIQAKFIETYKKPKDGGNFAVRYCPGPKSAAACKKARALFGDNLRAVDEFLARMFELNTDEVELFGTVYAAWNDLLLDQRPADDAAIVAEVHGWHATKRDKFPKAAVLKILTRIREWGYVPTGTAPRTLPPDPA